MEVQELANILFQWGPAGAAAALIVIAERKLRSRCEEARGRDKKVSTWLYAGNWVFIAVLLTLISTIWVIDRKQTTVTMAGIVQDLTPEYRINDPNETLFTKTQFKPSFLRDVHWHYTDSDIPKSIEIRLEKENDFNDYKVPVEIVEDILDIHIVFRKENLWLKGKNKLIALKSIHSASSELKSTISRNDNGTFRFFSLVGVAHADDMVNLDLVFEALDSNDSYIRQYASQYLVDHINTSLPSIEDRLLSSNSSENTLTGLVSVLARASSPDLESERNWRLSESAESRVFELAFSNNNVIATQSRRFLIRNMNDKYIEWLDSKCEFPNNDSQSDTEYCSFLALNLSYNLAIKKWETSKVQPKVNSIDTIESGLDTLDYGLNIIGYASKERSIQFGKLYYGKAFLHHELSKLQNSSDKISNIERAVSNFQSFLVYINENHEGVYEYSHHAKQAKCYIKNKNQNCFDDNPPD
tara:strand:+ start:1825 stop:3234 length:1410 start_codon:yes stop_codon:yes gene_type:complete